MTRLPAVLLLCLLPALLCAQQPVPHVQVDNPIAGFTISLPEDWAMAAGPGCIEMAIDATTGASLALQPALWFFNSPLPPQQEAEAMARELQLVSGGAQAQVAKVGEAWEVRMTSNGTRGPLVERWSCRSERGRNYVIGGFGRPNNFGQFQGDVDGAINSCKLIPTPDLCFFREPTENAYRMTIPNQWSWEGHIYRDLAVPGYFVWKVQNAQGTAGAFSAPPVAFGPQMPYTPAAQAAQVLVLPGLRKDLPDARLESVHELPRVASCAKQMVRMLGLGSNPRIDRVQADYVGTNRGQAVRVRVDIATWMLDQSPWLGGRGDWFLNASGAWGPINDFERGYSLGRGVIASVRTDARWRANQLNAANKALNDRNGVMDRLAHEWDRYIRDQEPITDPQDGQRKDVPIGDGDPWIDRDGKAHRVPPELERWAQEQGWRRIGR